MFFPQFNQALLIWLHVVTQYSEEEALLVVECEHMVDSRHTPAQQVIPPAQ